MMSTPDAPIPRRKLAHEVRDRLTELISADGMVPGDALPSERELMRHFGVGRPAVREALQSLVRVPGCEDLTLSEHRNISAAIEAGAAALAAQHMTDHLNRTNTLYRRVHHRGTGQVR